MNVEQLLEELYASDLDTPVMVEINGTVHDVHRFEDDSQGVYLIVDTVEEDRQWM